MKTYRLQLLPTQRYLLKTNYKESVRDVRVLFHHRIIP
jgi:hypothetical protein